MPTPRTVSRSLKRTSTQLTKIPDTAIAAIVEDVIAQASAIGGEFTRRRYPLYAEAKVKGGKTTRTATIFGRPAGFWSIRTYGRGGMRVGVRQRGSTRLKGFRVGSGHATSAGPAGPARRGRWDEVEEYANEVAGELLGREVDEVIGRG